MASTIKVNEIQNLAGNTALTIDGNGVVNQPQIPRFHAHLTSQTPLAIGYDDDWSESASWTTNYNVGNMFNAGKVTIPSDGVYQVHMNTYVSSYTGTYLACSVSGSAIVESTGESNFISFSAEQGPTDTGASITMLVQCSAGSEISFGIYTSGSSGCKAEARDTYLWGYKVG